jgi:ApaG protein
MPRARLHGKSRIPGKARIGLRAQTADESRAAVADHLAGVPARVAQSRGDGRLPWRVSIVHDGGMFTSEAVTRDIRVSVVSEYSPGRSNPQSQEWFFLYTITISNEGQETVQLLSRHWIITNGSGAVDEVKGDGVVGEQPILAPHESFTYTSGCPLKTPFGTMEGTYEMVSRGGERFAIKIAPFTLSEPYTVH